MSEDTRPDVHRVAVDDATVSYLAFGQQGGPVAVVSPGLTDGLAPVFHEPAAHAIPPPPEPFEDWQVLVASHRQPMPDGWTTRSMAGDLARLLEQVADRPAIITGHSMGGMVAQHLAATRPELVDRLVLSSTVAKADAPFIARLERWEDLLRAGRWVEFHRDAIRASFAGEERHRQLAELDEDEIDPPPPELVDRHLTLSGACKRHDAIGALPDIRCATLVLAGRSDELTRPDHARDLAARIPEATLVVLDGAGHGLPEQRSAAYARTVISFLAGDVQSVAGAEI